jgi:hypothetical protein
LLAIVLVGLAALTAMSRLDTVLERMHTSSGKEVAGGVTSIAKPLVSREDIDDVTQSWARWDDENIGKDAIGQASEDYDRFSRRLVGHKVIATWWLVVDSILFAPALASLLAALAWRRRRYFASVEGSAQLAREQPELWKAFGRMLELTSIIVVPAYFVADEVENALTGFIVHDTFAFPRSAIGVVSLIKIILVALAAMVVALVSLTWLPEYRGLRAKRWRAFRALRMPLLAVLLVVVVLTQLPSNVRDQLDDVIRGWQADPSQALLALTLAAALGLVIALLSLLLLDAYSEAAKGSEANPRTVGVLLAAGVVLTVFALVVDAAKPPLLPLGIMLTVYGSLSLLRSVQSLRNPREATPSVRAMVVTLAIAPATALELAMIHSEVGLGGWRAWRLTLLGLGIVSIAGVWLLAELVLEFSTARPPSAWVPWTLLASGLVLFVVPYIDLDHFSSVIGSIAALLWFAFGILFVGVGVDLLARQPARGLLAMLRFQRAPVVLAAVIVFVSASLLDSKPGFNKAETLPLERRPPVSLSVAIDDWLHICAEPSRTESGASPDECSTGVRPMFLIATSGGGARAAYWQIVVQDCVFGGQAPTDALDDATRLCKGAHPPSSIAFASGISGGSVGLAMEAASAYSQSSLLDERAVFSGGFLDRTLGNLLFRDLPHGFAHTNWFRRDRARALEENWMARVPGMDQGLFTSQGVYTSDGGQHVASYPINIYNSASVEEGCRVNVSVLRLSDTAPDESCRSLPAGDSPSDSPVDSTGANLAATRDISDYLCDNRGDLSLATAALLSARFPFVSPSGALEACVKQDDDSIFTYLVDGGYVDSSAASTISEIIPAIVQQVTTWNTEHKQTADPCVQPIVLQVDNGYSDVARRRPASRPKELLAPLTGSANVAGGRADAERQRLANLAVSELSRVGCAARLPVPPLPTYLHIYPQSHPGVQAPLGWALSEFSERDLEEQLFNKRNVEQVRFAKLWLSG